MTPEVKKKLEEMARESYAKVPWQYVNNSSFDSVYRNGFMSGAQAAWTLAVESKQNEIEIMRELLEEANSTVRTHAMQTYNKRCHELADRIDAILTPEEVKT